MGAAVSYYSPFSVIKYGFYYRFLAYILFPVKIARVTAWMIILIVMFLVEPPITSSEISFVGYHIFFYIEQVRQDIDSLNLLAGRTDF